MQSQLTFGLMSGIEQVEPISHGDIIVKRDHSRHVVVSVDDNIHGPVYVCVSLANGADAIVLDREVMYRSR